MALPTITSLPPAPQRGEAPATFSLKANNWVAAIDAWTTEVNALSTAMDALSITVEGYRDDAQQAVTDAAAQVVLAETARAGAESAQNGAETARAGAETAEAGAVAAAAAAQAAAGLPAIAGKTGNVLTVVGAPGSETVSFELPPVDGNQFSRTLQSSQQYFVTFNNPIQSAPIVSVTYEVPQAGVSNSQWTQSLEDGDLDLDSGLEIASSSSLRIDTSDPANIDKYLTATTNNSSQIDTDYWTDINDITLIGSFSQFASFAWSTDERETFSIARSGEGARNIVRNNAGTWEYNSAGSFSLEAWATAADKSDAFAQAMDVREVGSLVDESLDGSSSIAGISPAGFCFSNSGLSLYVGGLIGSDYVVRKYTCALPYDVTQGLSLVATSADLYPAILNFGIADIHVSDDETKLWIADPVNRTVREMEMTIAGDVSTLTDTGRTLSTAAQDGGSQSLRGVTLSPDLSKLYATTNGNDSVHQYNLTAGALDTASYFSSLSVSAQDTTPAYSFVYGNTLVVYGAQTTTVYQYDIANISDISSASYSGNSIPGLIGRRGIELNEKLYLVSQIPAIEQYSIGVLQNRMTKTQLDALGDADYPATADTIDFAVVLRTDTDTVTPTVNQITINYDGNVAHKVAINGSDYTFEKLSDNVGRLTWTRAQANVNGRIL